MILTALPPDVAPSLEQVPVELLLAGVFGVLIGLALWAFGRRVLRSAFVVGGAALGAAFGYVVAATISLPFPPWTLALGGAILFGLLGWAAYRPAMGITLAVLLGVASPAAVLAWAEHRGVEVFQSNSANSGAGTARTGEETDFLDRFRAIYDDMRAADNVADEIRRYLRNDKTTAQTDDNKPPAWIEAWQAVYADAKTEVTRRWSEAPEGVRRSLVLSGACGAILGLLIGLSLPGLSASIVTSMGGSSLVLVNGYALAAGAGYGEAGWMPSTATTWLILWAAATIFGIGIQWTLRSRAADKTEQ